MGDTESGSWGSRELTGFIRREQVARERDWPSMRPDEVVPFLLRVLVHLALMQDEPEDVYGPAYDCVSNALWEIERGRS